jgi:predicted  nucleic acid-binding Zn ribbon protein
VFSFECDFFPDLARTSIEEYCDTVVAAFAGTLYRNGVLLDSPQHLIALEDRGRLYGIAPTEDAFDPRYYNRYAHDELEKLLTLSRQPPSYRLLGKVIGLRDCCECADPAWYILFTTFLEDEPPVRCGDCSRPVPLYRLPRLEDEEEHGSIRHWASDYQACDRLWLGSAIGERWSYRQMSHLDSPLTREGREVCRAMAARMQKPWYYELMRWPRRPPEQCPACGEAWELDQPIHRLFTHKCDRCCLLSIDYSRNL